MAKKSKRLRSAPSLLKVINVTSAMSSDSASLYKSAVTRWWQWHKWTQTHEGKRSILPLTSVLYPPLPLWAFLVFTCLFIHCFDLQLTANETVYCSLLLFLLLLLSRVLSLNLSQTPSSLSPDWTVHALTVAVVLLFVSSLSSFGATLVQ